MEERSEAELERDADGVELRRESMARDAEPQRDVPGEWERADDLVDGDENMTQRRIGAGENRPADASWDERSWGETESPPHEGEGAEPAA